MPIISTFPLLGQGGSGSMESFNGRSGSVMPQTGDYTAEMVGAATMDQVNAAIKEAILDSWNGEYPSGGGGGTEEPGDNKIISGVPTQSGSLTYTGNSQTPKWNNYNKTQMTISGDINGTNAQTYTATFTPNSGYEWSDGTTDSKSVEWEIKKASIDVPETTSSFQYDGRQKSPSLVGYSSSKMTMRGDNTATNVGEYTVYFTPNSNYQWKDGTSDEKSVTWYITIATISAIPTQNGTLEYNGNVQTPSWKSYNSSQLTIGGDTSGVSVGEYTATFTPNENYVWSDGTSSAKSVVWVISKKSLAVPTPSGNFTYDGNPKSPTWVGYDSSKMTMSGTSTATNAGTYSVTFSLGDNYQWVGGSLNDKTVTWTIARISISYTPSQSNTLTYTGESQSPTWKNYDSTKLSISGSTSETNAGTYNVTFTPVANYQWNDGTTSSKTVSWSISKIAGSLSISPTTLSLTKASPTGTIYVTRPGDGYINASSSNTGIAAVSVNGTTITVVGKSTGNATITISVEAGTNHKAPSSKTVAVSVEIVGELNDCTWKQISSIAQDRQGENYWSIGDCKAVTVRGTVGTLSVNETLYVFIIGFDHNRTYEGDGIQFGTFKTSLTNGKDVCLVDSHYNANGTGTAKWFNIFHASEYEKLKKWKDSDMRYDILGSTKTKGADAPSNTATSPVSSTLMAALPSDLRAVMKPITKYTDTTGTTAFAAANVVSTVEYLPLMSEYEIFGNCNGSSAQEKPYQKQYEYYLSGNSKKKYQHTAISTASKCWLRSFSSPGQIATLNERASIASGEVCYAYNHKSLGISPVFKV